MTLDTLFDEEDINEIYNDTIVYSILKYQSLPEIWQEEFKNRYEKALQLLPKRNIESTTIKNTNITELKQKLTNYQKIYNSVLQLNKDTIDQSGFTIEHFLITELSQKRNEIDRVSYLFEFITNYITYSEEYFHYCLEVPPVDGFTFDFKNNIPVDSSINGLLVIGQGICENISWLIKYLGEKLNLQIGTINCKYKGNSHTLNTITMKDGNTYLLDATRLIRKDKTLEECFLVSANILNKEKNYQFKSDIILTTDYQGKIPNYQQEVQILIQNLNQLRPTIEDLATHTHGRLR